MIKVTLFGAAGRMGSMVLKALATEDDIEVVHAVESPEVPERSVSGVGIVHDDPDSPFESDVWVDVSLAEAAHRHALRADRLKRPILIGATGFSEAQRRDLENLETAHLLAPNLSVGISLLLGLLPHIRRTLGHGFDVAVAETHHRHKLDAPSGTARAIATVLEREGGSIQVTSQRIGEIVGEHRVRFAGEGEGIEVIHRAYSRMAFARGVAPAVRFLAGKKGGAYTMADVLGTA